MKKRLLGLLLGVMLISACVGCGAENATAEPTETVETTATTTEFTEQTTETTEEASEEVATETETTPEPTAEPESTEEPTPEPQSTYTYTDMSVIMYAQQTVNVRDLPDTIGNILGSLSTNDEITISAKCNETGWYRFEYNGNVAYVSNKYVSENKVEIQQAPADNSTAGTGSVASNWSDSYPKNQWVDMGEYFFYIANSQAEANQVCCYDYTHSVREVLEARYSDRSVYEAAAPTLKGNVPICWVSTVIYDENYNVAYIPTFIWE